MRVVFDGNIDAIAVAGAKYLLDRIVGVVFAQGESEDQRTLNLRRMYSMYLAMAAEQKFFLQ